MNESRLPAPLPVTMLTDFGLVDDFAGVCHAVIVARAPGAQVVHVTHGITPQSVLQGALVLRNTLPYLPVGVHMAVVDPGVGTERRGLAVRAADGRWFVGPDNGLLGPALDAAGGAVHAVVLESEEHRLHPVSATFHGRDVFAPAAAHIAAGHDPRQLGSEVDPATLVGLDLPRPVVTEAFIEATVWNVDRFGNVALLLTSAELRGLVADQPIAELVVRNSRYFATLATTFAHVRVGELLLYEDPYGSVAVAVNQGDAADMLRMRPGGKLVIAPVARSA